MSEAIELRDISRAGADAHWPAIALEVQEHLGSWITAANSQVSDQQLELRTTPRPEPSDAESCGWLIAAHLSATTRAGQPVVTLLESSIQATSIRQRVGVQEPKEPHVGVQLLNANNDPEGWIYPSWDTLEHSGSWNRPPFWHYPFNGVLAWSLAPGAEFFLLAYNQHSYSDRRAMPLLIAREQSSGLWLLAASIGSAWRGVGWSPRAGLPAGISCLQTCATGYWSYNYPATTGTAPLRLRSPAELRPTTLLPDVSRPTAHFDPLLLPPAFCSCTSSAFLITVEDSSDQWWLGLGNNLLLRLSP